MIYLWATFVTLLNAIWLLTVAANLPGTWLMILTAALANWVTSPEQPLMSWNVLIIAVVLAVIGEICEFLFGAAGSKRSGGSVWGAAGAVAGAVIGGIVGTFALPIPIVGSIVGACAGAFLGALTLEWAKAGRTWSAAITSGRGAAVGRFWGTLAKLAIGFVIWLLLAIAAFIPTPPPV